MNGSLLIEALVSVLVFVVCFFVFAKILTTMRIDWVGNRMFNVND